MPCRSPLYLTGSKLPAPCRKCYDCLQIRKLELIGRQVLEYQMHDPADCIFITLTFTDYWLAPYGSVDTAHMRSFFQELKRGLAQVGVKADFRYLYSSEYGEKNNRPHYHINIFGLSRLKLYYDVRDTEKKQPILLETIIGAAWGRGRIKVLDMNASSMQYVVKYVMKSLKHDEKPDHHHNRAREFFRGSNHLGMAAIDALAAHYKKTPSILEQIEANGDVPYKLENILPRGRSLLLSGKALDRLRLHFFDQKHVDQLKAENAMAESSRVASIVWERLITSPQLHKEVVTPRSIYVEENHAKHIKSHSRERLEREKGSS